MFNKTLNSVNKVLADFRNMEPIITDSGEIVFSQEQIDERIAQYGELYSRLSTQN